MLKVNNVAKVVSKLHTAVTQRDTPHSDLSSDLDHWYHSEIEEKPIC